MGAAGLMPGKAFADLPPVPETRPDLPSYLRDVRELSFEHLHTGERLTVPYYEHGQYVNDALTAVKHLMRDFRDNKEHIIDPGMLDILTEIKGRLGSEGPFQIVSAYRSPQTNAMLAAQSSGVAKKSYHLKGQAIDVSLPDRSLSQLHEVALNLQAGGVGYYPSSNFVHIDSGPVRTW